MPDLRYSSTTIRDIGLIFAAALFSVLPVIIYGPPIAVAADLLHHLQISNALYESLRHGILLPDWAADQNFGYGSVTIRFYPPLMHYCLAAGRMVFGSWYPAILAAFLTWSFIGGLGMYLWSREILEKPWQAAIAASLFVLSPYHLNQFYQSSMYGEFAALSVLPFCFYFAKRVCEKQSIVNVLGLAVSISLLILSNLPQAVIGAVGVAFYVIAYLRRANIFRRMLALSAAVILSLACTGFYWVRMVSEMSWINISQPNTDPNYDYRNHFLLNSLDLDGHGIWFASLMFVVLVLTLVAAMIISGRFRDIRRDYDIKVVSLLSALVIAMSLVISKPVWDLVTPLQKVQFPWRFLSIFSLTLSILLAYCTGFIDRETFRRKRPLVILFVGIYCIFFTFAAKQVMFGASFVEPSAYNEMAERSAASKGLMHWLPVWTNEKTFNEKAKVLAAGREVSIERWDPEQREFSVAEGPETRVRAAIMFYPHWHATVNGEHAEVVPSDDGAVSIDLPADRAYVKLFFVEPQGNLVSRKISILGWLACVGLFVFWFYYRRPRTREII